jgi:hypothetical protein
MSQLAVIASICCCEDNPCACATTAFALSWSGGVTLRADCADCPPETEDSLEAEVSSAASYVVVQDRTLCDWRTEWSETVSIERCDATGTDLSLTLRIFWAVAKSVIPSTRWVVTAQIYRESAVGSGVNLLGIVSWSTTTGSGADCPPTGVAFAWESGDLTVDTNLCWTPIFDCPVESWTRGTVTLS